MDIKLRIRKYRQSCPEFDLELSSLRSARRDVKSLIDQFEIIADKSVRNDILKKNPKYKCNRVLETGAMSRDRRTIIPDSDSVFVEDNSFIKQISDVVHKNQSSTVSGHSEGKTFKSKFPPSNKSRKNEKPRKIDILSDIFGRKKDGTQLSKSIPMEDSTRIKSVPRYVSSTSLKKEDIKKSSPSNQLRIGSPSYVRAQIKCFENQTADSVDIVLRKNPAESNGVVNKANDSLYRKRTNSYVLATQKELDLRTMKIYTDVEPNLTDVPNITNKTASFRECENSPGQSHRKFKFYPPPSPKPDRLKLVKPTTPILKVKQDIGHIEHRLEKMKATPDLNGDRKRSTYVSETVSKFEKDMQNPILAVVDLQEPKNQEGLKVEVNNILLMNRESGPIEKESRENLSIQINEAISQNFRNKRYISDKKQQESLCNRKSPVDGIVQINNNLKSKVKENNCDGDNIKNLTVLYHDEETLLSLENNAGEIIKIDNVGQTITQHVECQGNNSSKLIIEPSVNNIEQCTIDKIQDKNGLKENCFDEHDIITIVYHRTGNEANDNHANEHENSTLESVSLNKIEDEEISEITQNNAEKIANEDSHFENNEIQYKASVSVETQGTKPDYLIIMRDSTTINSNESSSVSCEVENETQNKTEIPQLHADSGTIDTNVIYLQYSVDDSEWTLDKLSENSMKINAWSSDSNVDMTCNNVLNEDGDCYSVRTVEVDNSESLSIQDKSCECNREYTEPGFESQKSIEEIQSTVKDLFAHVDNVCQTKPVESQRVSRLYSGKFGKGLSTPPNSLNQDNNNNTNPRKTEIERKEKDKILLANIGRLPDKNDGDNVDEELSSAEKYFLGYCEELKNDTYSVEVHNPRLSKELYTNEWVNNITQEYVVNGPESQTEDSVDEDSVFSGISTTSEDQEYQNFEFSFDGRGQQAWTYRDEQNNPMYVVQSLVDPGFSQNVQLRNNSATSTIDKKIEESETEYRRSIEAIKHTSRRRGLMDEIISTERRYVERSLRLLVEEYMPEMDRPDLKPGLMGRVNHIFGNVKVLYTYHKQFLPELESCKDADQIAECFLRHEPLFKHYPLYTRNKPLSDSVMKDYGSYFTRKQKELRDPLDLASYLLSPVQRLGKYCLLMKSLARECEKENINNEKVRKATEMLQKLMSLGNNLIATDSIIGCEVNLRDQGELLLRDKFQIVPPNKKFQFEGMVFLFQEAIIITSIQRNNASEVFEFREFFQLTDMGFTNNASENLSFRVWFRRHDKKSYTLKAKKPSMKDIWTKEIYNLLWKQLEASKRRKKKEQEQAGVIQLPIVVRPISIPHLKRIKSSPKSSRIQSGPVWYSDDS